MFFPADINPIPPPPPTPLPNHRHLPGTITSSIFIFIAAIFTTSVYLANSSPPSQVLGTQAPAEQSPVGGATPTPTLIPNFF